MARETPRNLSKFGSEKYSDQEGPETCLGIKFKTDNARREYFIGELRKKLKDPEFRKIEGFPVGNDEEIIKISDPPYYTACPNPWIGDFINEWNTEQIDKTFEHQYHREPFAADVSEGKNDPIYNAHSYHTKVPHRAIMRYILHYTQPGDIVLDGFCGTGMAGVASKMCASREVIESLGYQVGENGSVSLVDSGITTGANCKEFSKLGTRRSILFDLSPIATFVANNLNRPADTNVFVLNARIILDDVKRECGWMFETLHADSHQKGIINYVIWSDVLICPQCSGDFVFWNEAVCIMLHFMRILWN